MQTLIKKLAVQTALSLLLFGAVLLGFARVDWMAAFHLDSRILEQKLGGLYWQLLSQQLLFVQEDSLTRPLDTLLTRLCTANHLEGERIKLHLVCSREINAYAFPDNHLVIHTALLEDCRSESELCGVMAHEVAHIEHGHVMQKVMKELGLGIFIGMGGKGGELIGRTLGNFSSLAYDRSLESEADETAVRYLLAAQINPEGLAGFLHRLGEYENTPELSEWISTHPDSQKRSRKIIALCASADGEPFVPVLGKGTWERWKAQLKLFLE
ncbi:MAG: M48 family metallopeptidase [Prevotellaceae bacterium]|jgi:predicted Zn-dependent protease|nr:M48 family metallopeptidase [Prevotellaceae bacterium]